MKKSQNIKKINIILCHIFNKEIIKGNQGKEGRSIPTQVVQQNQQETQQETPQETPQATPQETSEETPTGPC
jgi:hypothetical protein